MDHRLDRPCIRRRPCTLQKHFRRFFESRLHTIPIFSKRLAPSLYDLDHPGWVDDPDLDLDYHLRETTLPAPGSEEQLLGVVEQLLATPIDRCRPLWEMWLIDEVFGGRFAILSKVHHALWDGVTGADVHAESGAATASRFIMRPRWSAQAKAASIRAP